MIEEMAAKLLHSLADDNADLQKQIGCMTGIFQIFDRKNALTGRRLSHRRLPPGDSHLNTGSSERLSFNVFQRSSLTGTNLNNSLNEKQRISIESSRTSFSSSSYDRIIFPETPSRQPTTNTTTPNLGRQSLDLRDVVKDSMYREARGLSVKTGSKEEAVGHAAKHKDSPQPLKPSKTADGSYGNGKKGKQNGSADMRESLRVLAKIQEAPWHYNETREGPWSSYEVKDGVSHSILKDAPRLSYDGREMNRISFESRDKIKSTIKVKEPPRFSLDGREKSMWDMNSDAKSNFAAKDLQNEGNSNETLYSSQQSLGTQKRPPSVVAKLMGLEALPDSASASTTQSGLVKSFPVENGDSSTNDLNRPIRIPKPPRSLSKQPISPRWKNPDLVMKPISRLPIESAPRKQAEGTPASHKNVKVSAKTPKLFPTVYSEIDKRLKDLEFNQSGKDLRALKQRVETMHAKGLLETRKEEQGSNFGTQDNAEPNSTSPGQKERMLNQRHSDHAIASSLRSSDSSRTCHSLIVIRQPVKPVEKSGLPASSVIPMDDFSLLHKTPCNGQADNRTRSARIQTVKDQSPRIRHWETASNSSDKETNVRNRSIQSSTRLQQSPKESTTGSVKSSGSVSPRLQQKKLELERKFRPPTPSSDSTKPRRQTYMMSTESSSPGGNNRLKSRKTLQNDEQLSQISNESRTSSQGDDMSQQSNSTVALYLKRDVEVSSVEQSSEINVGQIPSVRTGNHMVFVSKLKNPTFGLEDDGTLAEIVLDAPEHPSPVSVLDASVYRDETLSPVKQMPNFPTGDGSDHSNNQQSEKWNPVDNLLSDSRKKLQNIDILVKKLRRLNSTHDEASTDYIASLCENTNPDHRYISEILLASGLLLRDLDAGMTMFQLHSSDQPINPELFFVLEQTKASILLSKEERSPTKGTTCLKQRNLEKYHRKLIFDAVNEMIVKKLVSVGGYGETWLKSDKLAKESLPAQKLLKEVCSQIEMLQEKKTESKGEEEEDGLKGILWDDVMNGWEKWIDFNGEVSGVVLDVERYIFKDLVDEIVVGGAAGLRNKTLGRRQLFAK